MESAVWLRCFRGHPSYTVIKKEISGNIIKQNVDLRGWNWEIYSWLSTCIQYLSQWINMNWVSIMHFSLTDSCLQNAILQYMKSYSHSTCSYVNHTQRCCNIPYNTDKPVNNTGVAKYPSQTQLSSAPGVNILLDSWSNHNLNSKSKVVFSKTMNSLGRCLLKLINYQ